MRSEGAGLNATWTRSSRCRRYCSSPNPAPANIHAHTRRDSFSDCSFTFILVVGITAVTAGRRSSILLAANMKAYTPVYARRRHSIIRRVVSRGRGLWQIRDKSLQAVKISLLNASSSLTPAQVTVSRIWTYSLNSPLRRFFHFIASKCCASL